MDAKMLWIQMAGRGFFGLNALDNDPPRVLPCVRKPMGKVLGEESHEVQFGYIFDDVDEKKPA